MQIVVNRGRHGAVAHLRIALGHFQVKHVLRLWR
jgi:hypothetical protein